MYILVKLGVLPGKELCYTHLYSPRAWSKSILLVNSQKKKNWF